LVPCCYCDTNLLHFDASRFSKTIIKMGRRLNDNQFHFLRKSSNNRLRDQSVQIECKSQKNNFETFLFSRKPHTSCETSKLSHQVSKLQLTFNCLFFSFFSPFFFLPPNKSQLLRFIGVEKCKVQLFMPLLYRRDRFSRSLACCIIARERLSIPNWIGKREELLLLSFFSCSFGFLQYNKILSSSREGVGGRRNCRHLFEDDLL